MQIKKLLKPDTILLNMAVAFMYFLSAKSVLFLSLTEGGNVFVVWPPTGIALAALLIFGARIGVGIFFGALLLNVSIASLSLSLHTAVGNTIGPMIAYYLMKKFKVEHNYMLSLDGVYKFFISVLVGSLVTASNGVAALFVWGALPSEVELGTVWYAWYVGDLIGFAAITSLIMAIKYYWGELFKIKFLEFMALVILTSAVEYMVFGAGLFGDSGNYPMAYLALPPILWAVFRFTPPVSLLSVNLIALFAIIGTIAEYGPFAQYTAQESLVLLQTFIGISVLTVLLVVGVTNEKESAKKELELLNMTLSQRVEEEIAKSHKHQNILAQQSKMAAMGEMIGAIAHQWRQPLNALAITVQDLKMAHQYGDLTDEYINEAVQKSMYQIRFMSKTIDDFRNFFKPDKQKVDFSVFTAVLDSVKLMEAQLKTCSIDIKIKSPVDGEYHEAQYYESLDSRCCNYVVNGYPNEFKQVVLNIVSNAKDAITAQQESGKNKDGLVLISFQKENGRVILSIEDNGGGISSQAEQRLFEPYFTTKGESKGTGIGLYMSKMMIEENMGGSIRFRNGRDGAVFEINLASAAEEDK